VSEATTTGVGVGNGVDEAVVGTGVTVAWGGSVGVGGPDGVFVAGALVAVSAGPGVAEATGT
jgi:hypothetical protein